jgi:ATP-dependent Lhr-like helicase
VFTAPPVMRVMHGKEDVGYIQATFVSMHDRNTGPLCFRLSGRAWEVGQVDWGKSVLHVRPAEHGRVPSWLGLPGTLSMQLCQAMRDVLAREGDEGAWLSPAAAKELGMLASPTPASSPTAPPRWRSSPTASSGTPSPAAP